jgi:hypothetical protein
MPAYFHCKRVLRAPRLHQSRSGAPSQLGKLSSPPRRSHSPPRPPFPTHRRPLRLLSSPPDPAWRTPEGDHTLPPSPPWPPDLARHTRAPAWRSPGDEAQHPVKLLLGDGVEVLDISLPDRTVRIQTKISWVEYAAEFNGSWSVPAPDGPLMVSTARNSFVAFGCNVLAKLIPYGTVLSYASTCAAACMNTPDVSSCSGVRCCQTSIASLGSDLPWYGIQVKHLEGETGNYYHRAVFIVDQDWFNRVEAAMASNFSTLFFGNRFYEQVVLVDSVPVVLEWSLNLIRDSGLFVLSPIGPNRQTSDA